MGINRNAEECRVARRRLLSRTVCLLIFSLRELTRQASSRSLHSQAATVAATANHWSQGAVPTSQPNQTDTQSASSQPCRRAATARSPVATAMLQSPTAQPRCNSQQPAAASSQQTQAVSQPADKQGCSLRRCFALRVPRRKTR